MSANLTQTLSFGVHEGAAWNDATAIGGFPGVQNIKAIKTLKFMADNEVLIGVTGKTTIPGYYQNKPYLCYLKKVFQFTLAIMDTKTGNIRVEGPIGNGAGDSKYTGQTFAVEGPVLAFAGQTNSGGDPSNALTLSFFKSEQLALDKNLQ
ncbi:hypothetical protein CALVIDRAFT_525397 [Calocera viscosa TUFC12733]|uniref:Uncharacterized protein n=1 Tax=Calocera viscosa (strain TUFC12733) TaxID=1330018 RepID=A0A167Q2J0_CALVF|nr:hypothetical protein CALVIDRAFT_525397 [Calocera viscosa TUFC12733]